MPGQDLQGQSHGPGRGGRPVYRARRAGGRYGATSVSLLARKGGEA